MSNKVFQEIKEYLNQYGLDFVDNDGDCNAPLTWIGELFIKGFSPLNNKGIAILETLIDKYKFKHIEYKVLDDYEGAFSVVSINGQLYKLDVQLGSYEDISAYTDFWDWSPVKVTTKSVTAYE